jgi:CBS domain containing-hemolysin-like protein
LIVGKPTIDFDETRKIGSMDELRYVIEKSDKVLTGDDKKLIIHGLSFGSQLVGDVMTPRDEVKSIAKNEYLGPLTLHDLHKLGHTILPVIDEDLDHVVGILNIKSLLTLDEKRSTTAAKAMDKKVYYLRDNQTLLSALSAFLKTHRHLFIVVNKDRQTVGLISMDDVIKALLGRDVVSDFDDYDNLRAVSSQKHI